MNQIVLIIICLTCCSFISNKQNCQSKSLSSIISDLKAHIDNQETCEELYSDCKRLVEDIEEDIEKEDISSSRMKSLKADLFDAKSMLSFIGVVADCGNSNPIEKDKLDRSLTLTGGTIGLYSDKFCVQVHVVKLGSFESYLVKNIKAKLIRVECKYSYKSSDGLSKGSGTVTGGLWESNYRHVVDSRTLPNGYSVSFNITCEEI